MKKLKIKDRVFVNIDKKLNWWLPEDTYLRLKESLKKDDSENLAKEVIKAVFEIREIEMVEKDEE